MTAEQLAFRPPLQARSRESWMRVLQAGAEILEETGYEGFTIAAVCERAEVSVTTIYARVDNKDGLFFAVYDHVLAEIDGNDTALEPSETWDALSLEQLIRHAVAAVAHRFIDHTPFMRAVILLSGSHAEVRRRGSIWTTALGEAFTALLLERRDQIPREDAALAIDACYRIIFSAVAIYVAYGAGFESKRPLTETEFVAELCDVAARYLLGQVGD